LSLKNVARIAKEDMLKSLVRKTSNEKVYQETEGHMRRKHMLEKQILKMLTKLGWFKV